jgi:cell division septation protein DedD
MAGGKGDGDRSIGSSHILGLFFGTVLLCCIFFVLGFVMGRDQARTSSRVDVAPKTAATESAPPPGWSVSSPAASTHAVEKPAEPAAEKTGELAKPSAKPVAKAPAATAVAKPGALPPTPPKKTPKKKPTTAGKYSAPLIPKGAIVIQIAALTKEQDALAMAAALQDHGFPTFVLEPVSDKYYRVQVGPYADAKSADQAKRALEQEGFKVIIKR